jgi:hypothetical protein
VLDHGVTTASQGDQSLCMQLLNVRITPRQGTLVFQGLQGVLEIGR